LKFFVINVLEIETFDFFYGIILLFRIFKECPRCIS